MTWKHACALAVADSVVSDASPNNPDTVWSSASRFLIEIVAWVAGPWAAASATNSRWVALPVLVGLVAAPALFNTPGDKHQVPPIATPGPIRVMIEVCLLVVAVTSAAAVWPWWAAVAVVIVGIVMLATGQRRLRWLFAGAPDS